MEKIDLAKPGAVLFLGTMNAMPMMYALALKEMGQQVLYLVDVPATDKLSRPEHQYQQISYPYPEWIVELVLPSQLLVSLLPSLFMLWLKTKLKPLLLGQDIKAVFLGGQFIALAPRFAKTTQKLLLSYGADLEWFCNPQRVDALAEEFGAKSFLQYLPAWLRHSLIKVMVQRNYQGALCCQTLLFFPPGFSQTGDAMVQQLQQHGVHYIPRLDVSFTPLQGFDRSYKPRQGMLQILCPVRFHYQDISAQACGENKGNDLIIKALARFVRQHPQVQIHFFDKGPDVLNGRKLCDELGLSPFVTWHQQMSLPELLALYQQADICFDQVGNHWMGAVGIYALYFGKPLIVNAANLRHLPQLPLFQASSEQEILGHLLALTDENLAKLYYPKALASAEANFGPQHVLQELVR